MTEAMTRVHGLTPLVALLGLLVLALLHVGVVVRQTPAPTDLRTMLPLMTNNRAPAQQNNPTAIASLSGDFEVSGGLDGEVALASTADPAWK